MKPKDILKFYEEDGLYKGLNTMILFNFGILRTLKQFGKLDGIASGTYTASDLFSEENRRKNELYDEAVEDLVSRRNAYTSNIQQVVAGVKNDPEFLKEFQDAFIESYNNFYFYKTNKKFEDVIDGITIKDARLIQDINRAQTSNDPALEKLMESYTVYMREYKDYQTTKNIIADLFDAYQDDISSYGNITYHYGHPTNQNVLVAKKDTIDKLALSALHLNKTITDEHKQFEKSFEKYTKIYSKKEPESEEEKQTLAEFFELFMQKCVDRQLADHLAETIGKLYYRFDIQDLTKHVNIFTRLLENAADFAIGLTPITKSNTYKPESIYVHKNELDEIFALFKILEHYDNAKYSEDLKQKFNLDESNMQKGFIL